MKITLIIYGISWLILLCIFLYSKFKQMDTDSFNRNEWYLYLIIIVFAPFCILLVPYLLIKDCVKDRKARKQNMENEKKKKMAEERKRIALEIYKKAIDESGNPIGQPPVPPPVFQFPSDSCPPAISPTSA